MVWSASLALFLGIPFASFEPLSIADLAHPTEHLTDQELLFGADVIDRTKSECPAGQDCALAAGKNALDALNYRRSLSLNFGGNYIFSAILQQCVSRERIADEIACYKTFSEADLKTAMSRVGYKYRGVSWAGYRDVRIGMSFDEVEVILGYGTEISKVSGDGMSHSMYAWRSRSAQIIVSFQGNSVIGRSQVGF